MTNTVIMKKSQRDPETQGSECYWENGAGRPAQGRAATDLPLVKNAGPAKCSEVGPAVLQRVSTATEKGPPEVT